MAEKKCLLIGCGKQARAIAYYLAKKAGATMITFADKDPEAAVSLVRWLAQQDVRNDAVFSSNGPLIAPFDAMQAPEESAKAMAGYDVVINAAGNAMNVRLTQAAIMARVHYCDIGHDDVIISRQQILSNAAKGADVAILPGCGIAPGGSQVAVRHVIETFERTYGSVPESVDIRCGGIPRDPGKTPLKYAAGFSLDGLVTECQLPCKVLREGQETTEPPLHDIEQAGNIGGFRGLEACATGGNLGTLTRTYAGRIADLDYRTLRWPGHWAFMCLLDTAGLLSTKPLPNGRPTRDATVDYLGQLIPDVSAEHQDALLLRISATSSNPYQQVRFTMTDLFDETTGLSAMERTTGFSAAIVADMLATGAIEQRGVLTQEEGIPTKAFIDAWEAAGLRFEIITTP